MGKLVFGSVLLVVSFFLMLARSSNAGGKSSGMLRLFATAFLLLGVLFGLGALVVVVDPGQVGVKHAFGTVDPAPLLPGIHMVPPWSSVERYSTREEQFPRTQDEVENIAALSSEQMGMTVEAGLRWQINPIDAPRIFLEIGTEEQIHSIVLNAIRQGVRDGMVRFSINDIARRTEIASVMKSLVDSALTTAPRSGGERFPIATVTAFFLRDLQPPDQVVQAINAKIAQEQQIQTERHRVEVARLQSEQQKLLNQTLTPEALTKQYLEVLHDMKGSNNLVILVPTEGGIPMLDVAKLRGNMQ